jgi:hypothetical protein
MYLDISYIYIDAYIYSKRYVIRKNK